MSGAAQSPPVSQPELDRAVPECPYVGLVPFKEADAPYFFGRQRECEIVVANLTAFRLTLFYAASGVGKSSVLRAGVLPLLHRIAEESYADLGAPDTAVAYIREWSVAPLHAIATAVIDAVSQVPGAGPVEVPDSPRLSVSWLSEVMQRSGVTAVYLVLDQFEEYFLYHPDDRGENGLVSELGHILSTRGLQVNVLLSIREDALATLDRFKGRVPRLYDNYLRLAHLGRDAARAAIEGPLDHYNQVAPPESAMTIEPELTATLLDQLRTGYLSVAPDGAAFREAASRREDIETPYLQLVLTRLWEAERARGSSVLRQSTLDELGGAQTIVQTHLHTVMAGLSPEQIEVAAAIFHYLVTASGSKIALTAENLADWSGVPIRPIQRLLQSLSAGRHSILRPVPPPAGVAGQPRYEIFHDVMGAAVLDWRRQYVAQREQEKTSRKLVAEREEARAEAAQERERRRNDAETAQERERRLRTHTIFVLSVLLVLALVAAGIAVWQRQRASSAQHVAIARGMLAQADRLRDQDPRGALQLGVAARQFDTSPQTQASLRQTLTSTSSFRTILGHTGTVYGVAFAPDGRTLATASADQTARLWDLRVRDRPLPLGQPLIGHTGPVYGVAFAPDGHTLATASTDQTVRLWDLSDPNRPRPLGQPLAGHTGVVYGVAFAPDGRTLATASTDQTVRLWDLSDPNRPRPLDQPLTGHTGPVTGVAFAPDGHTLATASTDQTVRLWDLSDPNRPRPLDQPLTGHTGPVTGVAFAPDGHTLATASTDQTVRLWDLSDPNRPRPLDQPLTGHTGPVTGVAFSPDGRTLATASADQTARLWDLRVRDRPLPLGQPLIGHTGPVYGVAFAPDGRTLAAGSSDATVILWGLDDRDQPRRLGQPLTGHVNGVFGVAFSPDGHTLATASADQTVRLWDLSDRYRPNQLDPPLTGHTGPVFKVAFSPDGHTLATASADQTVRLWDLSDRYRPRLLGQPLTGHVNGVFGVAFAPDGRTLATASADLTVRLWELSNLNRPVPLGQPLTGHTDTVYDVAFAPDGHTLATASADRTVRLWDLSNLNRPVSLGQPLTGHTDTVYDVAFAPDGHTLATASDDRTVRLWDLSDRNRPLPLGQPLTGHTDGVLGMAFAPEGRTLATASFDRTVILWYLPRLDRFSGSEVREACLRAGGPLDRTTWDKYAPGVSYQDTCASR